MNKKCVVIGLLGVHLDQPRKSRDRWATWRPTVAICQQEDLIVDRFELIVERRYSKLANQVIQDIETVSPETSVRAHPVTLKDPWDLEEVYAGLHQFSREYAFDTDAEDYLMHITTGTHVAQICLFLLTESRHLPGRLIQTSPPPGRGRSKQAEAASVQGTFQIIDLDLSRYDELAKRFRQEHDEARSILKRGIETKDESFNALIDRIEKVTLATKAPILMSGPTGAGKTQLAKLIYELKHSRRQVSGPFIEVNCATIRGEQAMSALFGHTKGAFTGANSARAGLLKSADEGMLFLDEIGELGLDEQAMLLRAIEEKEFTPVGSDQSIHSDFQLIAGTNRDLMAEVSAGKFREDLLARINLWSFRLPGLSERRADIDPNLDYELQQFTRNNGQKITISKEARKAFLDFAMDPATPWNANFRDLNAAVTRMGTLAEGGRITIDLVTEEIARLRSSWQTTDARGDDDVLTSCLDDSQIAQLDHFDRVQLAEVIRVCRQSRSLSQAGRTLFAVSRKAKAKPNDADRLRKYLQRFGLSWDELL
ncbi:MAG TPA: transcriptional regulator [Rhodopirellula baltica]|uniref:Transcription regulator RtcR n=1 Tax=Rhodopirellula baltica (strain DSM 10527 / NCIMB 13988 / SH1) TaxID=243090 RepID=Q7ULP8_RHOBA|nr:RNA repair transcriptional activator RtcR [Rhodopirellula baltica]CAD76221.1 transcription regulator RtcR [Rhodopirellula baltica SH 1]HBE64515.1 transcriptional regulator [Rhodopirellula baltica]